MTKLTDSVFSVEVPEESKWHQIVHVSPGIDVLHYYIQDGYIENKSGGIDLPPGSWQLLCTTREATEEQAKGVVGSSEWYFPARHTRYIDYAHPVYENNKQAWAHGFGKAVESLNSLLTSKGLDVNKNYVLLKKEVI